MQHYSQERVDRPLEEKQQQQQQIDSFLFDDNDVSARQAAAEALEVGRATLAQAQHQGEQLNRAHREADHAQYALDKAGRLLRGMTWSGWVANLFTSDVDQPTTNDSSRKEPPLVYEGLPESCNAAAQAIQNYHANLQVLSSCDTRELQQTCTLVCDTMYQTALRQLQILESNPTIQAYHRELQSDLEYLRQRQAPSTRNPLPVPVTAAPHPSSLKNVDSASSSSNTSSSSSSTSLLIEQQDRHLHLLSQDLGELGLIASSLNEAVQQQTATIDRLTDKSDALTEQSRHVTRRADRLVHHRFGASTWLPFGTGSASQPQMECQRLILRHSDTGLYLTVLRGDVYLTPRYSTEACTLSLHRRPQTQLVGLCHTSTKAWLGQGAVLGGMVCSATTMGKREEWQIDFGKETNNGWSNSTLLCASANWGAGGYVVVRPRDNALILGGSTIEDRSKAARWTIRKEDENDNGKESDDHA